MKKVFMAACAAFALFAVSCSSSPEDKAVDIIKDATKKVENAKSATELTEISVETLKEAAELNKSLTDEEKEQVDKSEKVKEAGKAFQEAVEKKAKELGQSALGL